MLAFDSNPALRPTCNGLQSFAVPVPEQEHMEVVSDFWATNAVRRSSWQCEVAVHLLLHPKAVLWQPDQGSCVMHQTKPRLLPLFLGNLCHAPSEEAPPQARLPVRPPPRAVALQIAVTVTFRGIQVVNREGRSPMFVQNAVNTAHAVRSASCRKLPSL